MIDWPFRVPEPRTTIKETLIAKQYAHVELWRVHPVIRDYEVSDKGRVRRATPQMGTRIGKVLTPGVTQQGYKHVKIGGKSRRVAALVLETYVGPRPEGMEIMHRNDVKSDDMLSNLAWGSHAENYADRVSNGGGNHGSRHGLSKLTEDEVATIRKRYVPKRVTQKMLAAEFGVTRECIKLIVLGKRWKHV